VVTVSTPRHQIGVAHLRGCGTGRPRKELPEVYGWTLARQYWAERSGARFDLTTIGHLLRNAVYCTVNCTVSRWCS
jgi:hypothetical protein